MRSINFIVALTLLSAFQVTGEISKLVNKFTPDPGGFRQEYLEVLLLRKDLLENDGAVFVENNGTVFLLATGSTSAREKSTPAERGLEKLRRYKVAGQKAKRSASEFVAGMQIESKTTYSEKSVLVINNEETTFKIVKALSEKLRRNVLANMQTAVVTQRGSESINSKSRLHYGLNHFASWETKDGVSFFSAWVVQVSLK